MRPRIGVTVNDEDKSSGRRSGIWLGSDYTDALYETGAIPVVLAFTEDNEILDDMAQQLDGLLLTGGNDVSPIIFGEEPHIGLGEIAPIRDEMEVGLFRRMFSARKAVLGICRGIQVMNAAAGGNLYQDLAREWKGTLQHSQKAPRDYLAHSVLVERDTRLFQIYEHEEVMVNTFHHQAVRKVAPGFRVSAKSRDGLVEAIEHPDHAFMVGVQWHPENLWRRHEAHRRLFATFVNAAANRS